MEGSRFEGQHQHSGYTVSRVRSTRKALACDLQTISHSPIIDTLLKIVSGLVAVLNENREILAVNQSMLHTLGISDADNIIGLRPGEAIHCEHAHDDPGGCGTSAFCSTCGAAISIVTCLTKNRTVQRDCVVKVEKDGTAIDLYFRVRCSPLTLGDQRYLLLLFQDITIEQQHAALERTFFHDISNTISGLKLSTQMLEKEKDPCLVEELRVRIKHLALCLEKEVEIQRVLCCGDSHTYDVHFEEMDIRALLRDLQDMFCSHPVATHKSLDIANHTDLTHLLTDPTLLKRILVNILINAFEASQDGRHVKLSLDHDAETVAFRVWNPSVIPHDVGLRIFQRNFSTKGSEGRGLGTYGMKLFGETYLQGKVSFTSHANQGTTFCLELPRQPDVNAPPSLLRL